MSRKRRMRGRCNEVPLNSPQKRTASPRGEAKTGKTANKPSPCRCERNSSLRPWEKVSRKRRMRGRCNEIPLNSPQRRTASLRGEARIKGKAQTKGKPRRAERRGKTQKKTKKLIFYKIRRNIWGLTTIYCGSPPFIPQFIKK